MAGGGSVSNLHRSCSHLPIIPQRHTSSYSVLKRRHQQAGCRVLRAQDCLRSRWRRASSVIRAKDGSKITEKRQQASPTSSKQGNDVHRAPDGEPSDRTWDFFNWEQYTVPWQVPWGGRETAVGMVSWASTFLFVGLIAAPLLVRVAGLKDLSALSAADKSYLVLANQVAETVVGIAVVRWAVRGAKPLPKDIFNADVREPFRKPSGWLTWGLLGVVLAPVVIGLTVTVMSYSGYEAVGGQGTADGVARIISLDLPTYASLFTVTAVLAPVLEETVFRGFLLTSLTKWMPTPAAVLVSSAAFGLAHLSQRDLPQLVALGTLLGFSYVRSRNLLTPILIHGTWNGVVLTVLFALTASGVDVKQLLAQ